MIRRRFNDVMLVLLTTVILFNALLLNVSPAVASSKPQGDSSQATPWFTIGRDFTRQGYTTDRAPSIAYLNWTYKFTGPGPIWGSPIVVDGKVYVAVGDGGLHCFNMSTGAHLWSKTFGSLWTTPTYANGKLYFGDYILGVFYCVDAKTGEQIWNYTTGDRMCSSPAVAYGNVYFGSYTDYFYCLDAETGSEKWRFGPVGGDIYGEPAIADGVVYFGGKTVYKVWALNAYTGAEIWNKPVDAYVWSGVTVSQGKLLFATVDGTKPRRERVGTIYCLNAADGALLWNTSNVINVRASPSVNGDKVIFTKLEGVVCVNIGDGSQIWYFEYFGKYGGYAKPAIGDGKVYVGDDDSIIYCLDEKTGVLMWSYNVTKEIGEADDIDAGPSISDGWLFVGGYDRPALYAFSPEPPSPRGPKAIFTESKTTALVNETIVFDASGSLPGWNGTHYIPISNYSWNFGDGNVTTVTIPTISHAYNATGTYTVNLTVTCQDDPVLISLGLTKNSTTAIKTITPIPVEAPWPMYQHDASNTGVSPGPSPSTAEILWTRDVGVAPRLCEGGGPTGSPGAPAVFGLKVYEGRLDNKTYCLDEATGNVLWTFETKGPIYSTPAIVDGKVYITSTDNTTYCLDANNGALIWKYTTRNSIWGSPTVVDGKVYFGSLDRNVYCLDATDGSLIWYYITGGSIYTTPAVVDGKVYFGSFDGNVYCLDAATGSTLWSRLTDGNVRASPTVADGKVYVVTYYPGKTLYCLSAADGSLIWSKGQVVTSFSTPVVAAGKVYITLFYYNYVKQFDAATGEEGWTWTQEGGLSMANAIESDIAYADGRIFFGSFDDHLYCLDAANGWEIWRYKAGDNVHSPSIADGLVFVGSDDGKIYAFGTRVPPDMVEPSIGTPYHVPLEPGEWVNVTVSVNVTDLESGVKNVTLSYTTNNGTSWTDMPMKYNSTTRLYEAIIPGQSYCTWVKYKIIAYDNAGNNATKDKAGQLYVYHVIPEFPAWAPTLLMLFAIIMAITAFKPRIRSHNMLKFSGTAN